MNKEIFDYIQKLSTNDEKTLMLKALKTGEEYGELVKKILGYEMAPQHSHRFIVEENILEEIADIFLCVLSIAYNLNFTTEEIFAMIEKKAEYWDSLQVKEKKAKFPLPFEIHITVKNDSNIDKFRETCILLGVKPILLDLQEQNGEQIILKDLMTSSKKYGNNQEIYNEMRRISVGLRDAGFEVLREKIETTPLHPQAPSDNDINKFTGMKPGNYFESHIGVILHKQRKPQLITIAEKWGAHFSKNAFKVYDENTSKQMITFRSTQDTFESFKCMIRNITNDLDEAKFEYEKPIIEYSIFDTKQNHDKTWIK